MSAIRSEEYKRGYAAGYIAGLEKAANVRAAVQEIDERRAEHRRTKPLVLLGAR